jgi:hypothetical protein
VVGGWAVGLTGRLYDSRILSSGHPSKAPDRWRVLHAPARCEVLSKCMRRPYGGVAMRGELMDSVLTRHRLSSDHDTRRFGVKEFVPRGNGDEAPREGELAAWSNGVVGGRTE